MTHHYGHTEDIEPLENIIGILLNTPNFNRNIENADGDTALHISAAVRWRPSDKLPQYLWTRGSHPDIVSGFTIRNNRGETPFFIAVKSSNMPIINFMRKKSNVTDQNGVHFTNIPDNEGQTPLHVVSRNDPEIAAWLIGTADVQARNKKQQTALHTMVDSGFFSTRIASILIDAGLDVDAIDADGMTALQTLSADRTYSLSHYAESMRFLLAAGADINKEGPAGNRSLHFMIFFLESPLTHDRVLFLLDAGADPNAQNDNGVTPLQVAVDPSILSGDLNEGFLSSYRSRDNIVHTVRYLVNFGANPELESNTGENAYTLLAGSKFVKEHKSSFPNLRKQLKTIMKQGR